MSTAGKYVTQEVDSKSSGAHVKSHPQSAGNSITLTSELITTLDTH